jgi:hypothetical protein
MVIGYSNQKVIKAGSEVNEFNIFNTDILHKI